MNLNEVPEIVAVAVVGCQRTIVHGGGQGARGIDFFCKSLTLTGYKTCCFYLKLELHGLEGGGGLDAPGAGILGDVHGRGGNGGGLPQ